MARRPKKQRSFAKQMETVVTQAMVVGIEQGVGNAAQRITRTLNAEMKKVNSRFFIELVRMGIGRRKAPTLGTRQLDWRPLKAGWKKKNKGLFYKHKGQLQRQLLARSGTRIFAPHLRIDGYAPFDIQKVGKKIVVRKLTRAGFRRISAATLARDTGFQLRVAKNNQIRAFQAKRNGALTPASVKTLLKPIPTEIRIFPLGEQFTGSEIAMEEEAIAAIPRVTKLGAKIQNWRGQRYRPLLGPFMSWWLQTKYQRAIKKAAA